MVRLVSALWRGTRFKYSKHCCMEELKGRIFGQPVGGSLRGGHSGFSQSWHRGKSMLTDDPSVSDCSCHPPRYPPSGKREGQNCASREEGLISAASGKGRPFSTALPPSTALSSTMSCQEALHQLQHPALSPLHHQ